jgi:ribA/ribD-fused uncharacterized protein
MSDIRFYRTDEVPYGKFSNFAKFPITINDVVWPTSEHYFQAQKFNDLPEYQEQIRKASNGQNAANLGRSRQVKLRDDWEAVKEDVMMVALRAKFTQHESLRKLLLETKGKNLIEHTANDSYWADGGDGTGQNRLGVLLMRLRDELAKN